MLHSLLIINTGSSSMKVTLFTIQKKEIVKREHYDHIGSLNALFKKIEKDSLIAIAHRMVHGGSLFTNSILLDESNLKSLENLSDLAPLHNPPCLENIHKALEYYSWKIPQIVTFDTAFHSTIPDYAALYAIAYRYYETLHIKRYGFHGISHNYLWNRYSKNEAGQKIITLHLGGGCSICAIKNGVSIDTSMGFTPLEGLVMGTRCGDIDPGLLEYLCKTENITLDKMNYLLNQESGLKGICGTCDMRTVTANLDKPLFKLAFDIFCYRIIKYIGAYFAILEGIDALIFSGGIGENSPEIRSKILQGLSWMQITMDEAKNKHVKGMPPGEMRSIHLKGSHLNVFVIATDENLLIAKEAFKLIAT